MQVRRVSEFVSEYKDLTRNAANEEEIRSRFETVAISKLGIRDLKLEQSRQDVRRNRVIIECKGKGLFNGRKDSAKFNEAVGQLKRYISEQAHTDDLQSSDYTGVCFDGLHLAFVYIEANGKERVSDIQPFNEYSATVLVLALDRDERIELTPHNVVADFGPQSSVAQSMLNALWEHLNSSLAVDVNRVKMLFSEWMDLFEQSTSLGQIGQIRLGLYLESIGLPSNADLTRVLFVLHTYHALFFKLLAAEVVLANTLITGAPADYCFSTASLNDDDLLKSLEWNIEESTLFRRVHILNFVEAPFFTWYLEKASPAVAKAIRGLMQRLSLYRLSGLQLDRTRDVVKRIYQQLVPAVLRHNIGEYFTPEWLVEFTLDRVGYVGADILDNKILDPCCGSGNFLIHAIERYKVQARTAGYKDEDILKNITDHIYGFDLNPLAVLTARINYLIAISDLITTYSEVEIPIYQADAVYAPTVSKKRNIGTTRIYQIGTRKVTIDIELPEALIQRNRLFARVLEIMESTIREGDSEARFLTSLAREPEYAYETNHLKWKPLLLDMFRKVEELEHDDWNRIWCRIVRNYFASVAVGKCRFIAGNPPWVRWSELPASYTQRVKPTCDEYGIFSEDKFFGGNELDISAMITYTVADKWLDDQGGRLSFIIPQMHFQSQSSGGFRRFKVKGVPFKVELIDDFVDVRPFAGLGNKPAVLSLEKGYKTTYPVKYLRWKRATPKALQEDITWNTAQSLLTYVIQEANALSGLGWRWSILPPGHFEMLRVLDGEDPRIVGRKGIVTDKNGAYFIEPLGLGKRPNTIRFRNRPDQGGPDHPVPQVVADIELELVYPLIKGAANIRAFRATTSPLYVIVPNKRINVDAIPTVTAFFENYPDALHYFRLINREREPGKSGGLLDERSTWKKRMKPQFDRRVQQGRMVAEDSPFYAAYDVGDYTFSPYKVVWAEMAGTVQAAVITEAIVPFGGGIKPIVPDHKVYFVAFDDLSYAHYVCALLNSEPVRTFIDSFTIKIQVGTLFRHIVLPKFDVSIAEHVELAHYSQEAHAILASSSGIDSIDTQQKTIDRLAYHIIASAEPLPKATQIDFDI